MPEALGVGDPCIVAIANGQLLLAGRVEAAKPILDRLTALRRNRQLEIGRRSSGR